MATALKPLVMAEAMTPVDRPTVDPTAQKAIFDRRIAASRVSSSIMVTWCR